MCGAAPQYPVWSRFVSRAAINDETPMNFRPPKQEMIGSEPVPLVCTVCDDVQRFLNPQDFRDEGRERMRHQCGNVVR